MKTVKTILDVRTKPEYENDHVKGSMNIPLNEIQARLEEIQDLKQPILVCCEGGNRAEVAVKFLQNKNVNCENGGGWSDVETALKDKEINLKS